jgi:RNA methyltransferase, TrmH family
MPPQITSTSNERVKHARRVREGREPDLIFIEGQRLAEEALKSGIHMEAAFLSSEHEEARLNALAEHLSASQTPLFWTQSQVLDSMSDTMHSQGIIIIAKRPKPPSFPIAGRLFIALDRIQDPGNMGTLLRTAEAAGTDGVLVLAGSVDVFSPKVLRSSPTSLPRPCCRSSISSASTSSPQQAEVSSTTPTMTGVCPRSCYSATKAMA